MFDVYLSNRVWPDSGRGHSIIRNMCQNRRETTCLFCSWFLAVYLHSRRKMKPDRTTVINIYKQKATVEGVYIGRGSKWGNPFVIGIDGNRDEVCEKYIKKNDRENFKAMVRRELAGKVLKCYCVPKRCHGDWLAAVANGEIR